MTTPSIEALTRHLAALPPEFLEEPPPAGGDRLDTAALVADLVADLGAPRPGAAALAPFLPATPGKAEQNRLLLIQIACHLLNSPDLRPYPLTRERALPWLAAGLDPLAGAAPARHYLEEPEGREELVRFCLKALDLLPEGESREQFDDRLMAVSSVERQRVLEAARAARERTRRLQQEEAERARRVQEELARKAAESAAAKPSRE